MARKELIKKTLDTLERLPSEKLREVSDFAEYLLKKYEEDVLQAGMEKLVDDSSNFDFLREEEELYSVKDLKKRYR